MIMAVILVAIASRAENPFSVETENPFRQRTNYIILASKQTNRWFAWEPSNMAPPMPPIDVASGLLCGRDYYTP